MNKLLLRRKLIFALLSLILVFLFNVSLRQDGLAVVDLKQNVVNLASNPVSCGRGLEGLSAVQSSSARRALRIYMSCIDNNVRRGLRNGFNRDFSPTVINDIVENTEQVVTSGADSGGNLGFARGNSLLRSPLVSIGYSDVESWYYSGYDECSIGGEFVVGWDSGESSPDCVNISARPGSRIGPSVKSRYIQTGQRKQSSDLESSSTLFRFYTNPHNANASALHYYCNAVSPQEEAWGVAISENSLSGGATGLAGQIDQVISQTCQKAQEICAQRGGSNCLVVSEDVWRSSVPSNLPQLRNVDLFLSCFNQQSPYYTKSGISRSEVFTALSQMENTALQDGARNCSFKIKYFYDIIISPSSSNRTLVRFGPSEEGHVIDDLVGTISIRRSGDPANTDPIILNPGERFLIESLDPQNSGQLSKTIPEDNRLQVVERPVVKAFLDKTRWPASLGSEIDAYKLALQEQFLPRSPAVQVNQRTVAGVSVVIAEVDLANPDAILTLALDGDVRAAGGLTQFAERRDAALILSGTFRDPNNQNWTSISEGRTIAGEASKDWSVYTVLGIRRNNQPEMIARANGPSWNEYWFALTSTPRLVNGGVPEVTERHPEEQMNINASAGRAAIGFSRTNRKLYHVITNTGVSLPKMAEIMREVGCDDAMNLEGGGGYFIVHNGRVYGPGEVRAPVIVVHDSQHPPSPQVQGAWRRF